MKVHFTTLGCPKNQVDSELMLGMLTRAGHEIAEAAESADCLVVVPEDVTEVEAGETVEVLMLEESR